MTRNPNLQLIQYKILHRVHYTGQRLFKMGFAQSNICPQCTGNQLDNYFHALWLCTPVQRFWVQVCKDLSLCLGCKIPISPPVCLLGDFEGSSMGKKSVCMAFTALCIAKKTILMNWKSKDKLNINQYRDLLLDHINLETASASPSDRSLWAPLIDSIT